MNAILLVKVIRNRLCLLKVPLAFSKEKLMVGPGEERIAAKILFIPSGMDGTNSSELSILFKTWYLSLSMPVKKKGL